MTSSQRDTYGDYYNNAADNTNYTWGCLDNWRYWTDSALGLKLAAATATLVAAASTL